LCVRILREKLKSRKFSLAPKKNNMKGMNVPALCITLEQSPFLSKIVSTSFHWQHLSQMEDRRLGKTNPTLTL